MKRRTLGSVLHRLREAGKGEVGPRRPKLSFGDWDRFPAGETVLNVCHPDWRGVRTATYSYGAPVVEVADAAPPADEIIAHCRARSVRTLVVQGLPPGSSTLIRKAREAGLETRCVLHSSMTQHGAEPGEAEVVATVLELLTEGSLARLGFAKAGQPEAFRALGYDAWYVPNRMPVLPDLEPIQFGGSLEIGVFAEPFWRKNVPPQLGAVAMLGGRAHVMYKPDLPYLDDLDIVEHGELPWDEFIRLQGSVDLNLYVTLSECQPLTPVESYVAGVPCLFSRTSILFRSDPELYELSTVGEIDDPQAIADAARVLLDRRDEAVERARRWMAAFDTEAQQRWEQFTAR